MLTRATISSEDLILRGNNCEDILTECKLPTYFVSRSSVHYNVQIMKGNQVCMARKKEIFALLESNMKDYYKRANITGWNQKKEWRESFHCNSTFIILSDDSSILHGFVQFDFSWDDVDAPELPVLYCLQLQTHDDAKGTGLGSFLLMILQQISSHFHMAKIMLTCFKINAPALRFYHKLGYIVDENSPSKFGHEASYEILSLTPTTDSSNES